MAETTLNQIYGSIAESIMVIGKNGEILYLNQRAEEIFAVKKEDAVGRKIVNCFMDRPENDEFLSAVLDCIYTPEERHTAEVSYSNGSRTYELLISSVYAAAKDFKGLVIVFSDITELARLRDEEQRLKTIKENNRMLLRQNEILGEAFSNYMDDDIVKELLVDARDTGHKVKKAHITIFMIMSPAIQKLFARMAPEDYLAMLNHYLDEAITVIKEHHGTVIELHSDNILAIFGAPRNFANHADEAFSAARELRNKAEAINLWNREHGYPEIAWKTGIHTDDMLVGVIGGPETSKYNTMGAGLNFTARMTWTAKDGDFVISKDAEKEITLPYEVESRYEVVPKGLSEPVEISKIL